MDFSSRTVAILIALLVAGVLTACALIVPGLPQREAFLAGGITVAACFLLMYLTFEALIFREINGIYAGLEHIKRKEFKKLSNKFLFRPEPVKRVLPGVADVRTNVRAFGDRRRLPERGELLLHVAGAT